MKKILFLVCLCLTTIAVSAELTATGTYKKYQEITSNTTKKDTVQVFIFNGLTSAQIEYSGSETGLKWYKYSDPTNPTTGVSSFYSIEDNNGYVLEEANGHKIYFWVIDYQLNKPVLNSIAAEDNPTAQCKNVNLDIVSAISELSYRTIDNSLHYLPSRKFELKYTSLSWSGTAWAPKDTTITITSPIATIQSVPAPYCTTTFKLSGDQYATDDLKIDPVSVTSIPYTPVAVICHETSVVQTRDAKNENERPTNPKNVSGSAPLDMIFYSNPNDPIVTFYNWEIFKDKSKTSLIGDRKEKTTPYIFTEPGSYVVKVTVSNDKACSYSDSITVTVSTSSIQAPNVFTPNGDGMNDEFRVAYKSILTFHCWVYNRWGRLVYEWTDPMKGWDGNINGKEASPGPYYYVIKATGNDGQKYKLKGDINLLR